MVEEYTGLGADYDADQEEDDGGSEAEAEGGGEEDGDNLREMMARNVRLLQPRHRTWYAAYDTHSSSPLDTGTETETEPAATAAVAPRGKQTKRGSGGVEQPDNKTKVRKFGKKK